MASERIQRRIDRLLDEADEAIGQGDWETARDTASSASSRSRSILRCMRSLAIALLQVDVG